MSLIERIEQAEGPSRELDAMIHFAIKNGIGCGAAQDAPHYTSSIDAALMLVADWNWIAIRYAIASALESVRKAGLDPIKHLPRFIVVEALKAKEANDGK